MLDQERVRMFGGPLGGNDEQKKARPAGQVSATSQPPPPPTPPPVQPAPTAPIMSGNESVPQAGGLATRQPAQSFGSQMQPQPQRQPVQQMQFGGGQMPASGQLPPAMSQRFAPFGGQPMPQRPLPFGAGNLAQQFNGQRVQPGAIRPGFGQPQQSGFGMTQSPQLNPWMRR